ncbi:uncharacterized protein LOC119370598 [Jatropha curcas]|uniref:uncharacterized protein LOC119370598 n=1 Tax=Jatropha curcas TaxID=180498 RepID=UPI001894E723|nr:uncharacterized protein LOC119370598 [Jatropha curcas]
MDKTNSLWLGRSDGQQRDVTDGGSWSSQKYSKQVGLDSYFSICESGSVTSVCKCQETMGWILSSLSESVLSQVVGVKTTHEAWTRLQTIYASGSRAQIHDLIDHILRGLGPDCRPFTRNVEARLTSISFDDLFGLLLSEEMQIQSSNTSLTTLAVAHFTHRQSSRGGYRVRGRGGQRGGYQSNGGRGRNQNSETYCPTYYNCGGSGHTSNVCPSPKITNQNTKPASNYSSSPTPSNKPWIVDSGATHSKPNQSHHI